MAWRDQTADIAWTPLPGIKLSANTKGATLSSPFLADGAIHTLDDGLEIDADGRFRLLGRTDRIVKVEEKRLSLPEMEGRMQEHPWVAQAAAVLLNGSRQRIGMAVTLNETGQAALAAQGRQNMRTHLRAHLAPHFDTVLLPRYWRYPESLPYTAQGKLPVAALQALFK
jgi:acyl-coenzyme A synthetase/AMP-(fatty) acid ligase